MGSQQTGCQKRKADANDVARRDVMENPLYRNVTTTNSRPKPHENDCQVNPPTTPEFYDQITDVNLNDFYDFDMYDNYDESDDCAPSSARGVRSPESSYMTQSNNTHGAAMQSYL
ncbi:hypothetical protein PsorP6_015954 [Peronosclerospora sorghi]|uniref:Uncharacterized protein n=1 Tax=Peronosclerospora sorghi TaxID=230839 RepID=A0ACC0WM00_9STRA|nr:hypothetical protein PsorP6_015954 [Peronosclerospora sorghi]